MQHWYTAIFRATINMPSIVPLKNIFIFTKIGAECEHAARASAKLCAVSELEVGPFLALCDTLFGGGS